MRILGILILGAALPFSALVRTALELIVGAALMLLSLVAGAGMLLVDALSRLAGRRTPPMDPPGAPAAASLSVVVLAPRGDVRLGVVLDTLRDELGRLGGPPQVIVVAMGGEARRAASAGGAGPQVEWIDHPEGTFPASALGEGVAQATRDVVVVLDGGRDLAAGLVRQLLDGLDDPAGFAVIAARASTELRSGGEPGGRAPVRAEASGHDDPCDPLTAALWADGGAVAFDRRKLEALGGIDPIFATPDAALLDLGLRAAGRGWSMRSVVLPSMSPAPVGFAERPLEPRSRRAWCRDLHAVRWCNLTDPLSTICESLCLPLRALRRARRDTAPGRPVLAAEVGGVLAALGVLPGVLRRRLANSRSQAPGNLEALRSIGARVRPASATREGARRRLLILAGRLPSPVAEGSWLLATRVRELARRHDVTLFAFVEHASQARAAEPLRASCSRVITHVRTPSHGLPNLHHLVPYRLAREYSARHMHQAVRDVLATADFDIVLVEGAEMSHLVQDELAGAPSICTLPEPLSRCQERAFRSAHGLPRLARALEWAQSLEHERRCLPAFDRVVTLSSEDEARLRSRLPDLQVTTIPGGVDLDRFWPLPRREPEALVTFVCSYQHPSHVEGAVWLAREVFPAVRDELAGARLRILGRDPAGEIRALGCLPGVEAWGAVEDLREPMAESAVLALPILRGGGPRGKVLEGWAAGRAVVVTPLGAEGYPVEDGVNARVALDAAGFACALLDCLRDAALRRRLGDEGRRLVLERFGSAAAATRYERLFDELLGAGRSAAAARERRGGSRHVSLG